MSRRFDPRWFLALPVSWFVVAACSATPPSDDEFEGAGGGATAGGSSGSGAAGAGGSGAPGAGGSGAGVGVQLDGGGGSSSCATSTATATATPAIIQVVLDTSGSMNEQTGTESRWTATRGALTRAMAALPDTSTVGLVEFPDVDAQTIRTTCFSKRAKVPLALLTGQQRSAIDAALVATTPYGGTPTHDAYLFGAQRVLEHPAQGNRVVLLLTDGEPTYLLNCNGRGNAAVDTAPLVEQVKFVADAGIRTYVIGAPGSEPARSTLSRMATAGGTGGVRCNDAGPNYCHFDMTSAPDFAVALAGTLEAISGQALSCEYPIPAPTGGEIDRDKVNVRYTPSSGAPEDFARDGTGSDCTRGWQYSADGKSILLCGDTCERVKKDARGRIEIAFGCATIVS
jgi:hypothetical protein